MWSAWFFFFNVAALNQVQETDKYSFMPLPHERIQDISLAKKCNKVNIVEWQDDSPSEDKIKILNEVCNLAVEKFPIFLKTKKISVPNNLNLEISISLLNRGFASRQLNDSKRFADLDLPKHSDGTPHTIYGYYHFNTKYLFAINEVLNNKKPNRFFKMILAHEIFHALTHQNNLIQQMPYPEYDSDESYARDFTSFLGLGQ